MSFRLDAKCPSEISQGKCFTPVLCVKGANASGKTQILKALTFLAVFSTQSFDQDPDTVIPVAAFFDSPDPTDFYAEFSINDVEYRYELTVTDSEVLHEALYRTKARQVRLFERGANGFSYVAKILSALRPITLRKNVSVISTVRQYQIDTTELDNVYQFFKFFTSNVGFSGLREVPRDIHQVSKILYNNSDVFEFVKTFISECDTGISDIKIAEVVDPDAETRYAPIFYHEVDGQQHPVPAMVESSGTKALYRDLAGYYVGLKMGGIVIADELDINLHPYLLAKIVDLFLDDETNNNGAQLIFSTHNTEILDHLGRYRTYLVNKKENQSFAYRLDEIPGDILRNDRPVSPAYRDARVGGVPQL
jgi:hypothetical protein